MVQAQESTAQDAIDESDPLQMAASVMSGVGQGLTGTSSGATIGGSMGRAMLEEESELGSGSGLMAAFGQQSGVQQVLGGSGAQAFIGNPGSGLQQQTQGPMLAGQSSQINGLGNQAANQSNVSVTISGPANQVEQVLQGMQGSSQNAMQTGSNTGFGSGSQSGMQNPILAAAGSGMQSGRENGTGMSHGMRGQSRMGTATVERGGKISSGLETQASANKDNVMQAQSDAKSTQTSLGKSADMGFEM